MNVLSVSRKSSTAPGVVRASIQRWVGWILLLVYGLPAAVGPSWHHHDVQQTPLAEPEVVEQCSTTCSSCGQLHLLRAQRDQATGKPANIPKFEISQDNCSCAVCLFYGQAVWSNNDSTIQATCAIQTAILASHRSPLLRPVRRANSRGPPTAGAVIS